MRLPCCIICGKPIEGECTFWVHPRCLTGDGWDLRAPFTEWPDWARALRLDEERQRENETDRIEKGIEVYDFCDLGDGGDDEEACSGLS